MNNSNKLSINYYANLKSLHPHLLNDIRSQTVCKALYEGLTRVNLEGNVELALAKKIEISSCKKKYTFTLRDTHWSNGKKVTSSDFAKAWKQAIHPKSKCSYVKRFFLVKGAKQAYNQEISLDKVEISTPFENMLIVELEYPAPYFLELIADPIYSPIYSSDIDKEPSIFNGPFIVDQYEINKKLTLISNSYYWDAKTVQLKKIEISFIKDMQTAFSMYEKGQLDYLGSPFINLPDDIIKTASNVKIQQASAPFWVFFNVENQKLKSASIRKALAYSIDRKKILQYIIPKQKEPLYSIFPKDLSCLSSKDLLKDHDVEKALKLFDEGLKELKMNRKDFHLTLNHSSSSDQEKIALYLKDQWQKVFGIKIALQKDDWNTFYSKAISGDYEVGESFNCNLYDDPSYLMEFFEYSHSNYSRWENPNYQKYFSLANQSEDPNKRKSYLKKAEEILVEEMPVIPIYNHAHLYLCNEKLMNFSAPKFNYADFKWAYFDDEL